MKAGGVDEDEDANEEKDMSIVLRRSEGSGRFAEAGILKRLQFIDWMCFENFEIVFGPNVNVIHGQNGSEFLRLQLFSMSSTHFPATMQGYVGVAAACLDSGLRLCQRWPCLSNV